MHRGLAGGCAPVACQNPATIVLKDDDLDLAFVAPDPPAEGALPGFIHVYLDDPAKAEVLVRSRRRKSSLRGAGGIESGRLLRAR